MEFPSLEWRQPRDFRPRRCELGGSAFQRKSENRGSSRGPAVNLFSWETSSVSKTKGMETISDSPTGSTELFATCQLGNHLLAAHGDHAIYGMQEERGIAVPFREGSSLSAERNGMSPRTKRSSCA